MKTTQLFCILSLASTAVFAAPATDQRLGDDGGGIKLVRRNDYPNVPGSDTPGGYDSSSPDGACKMGQNCRKVARQNWGHHGGGPKLKRQDEDDGTADQDWGHHSGGPKVMRRDVTGDDGDGIKFMRRDITCSDGSAPSAWYNCNGGNPATCGGLVCDNTNTCAGENSPCYYCPDFRQGASGPYATC